MVVGGWWWWWMGGEVRERDSKVRGEGSWRGGEGKGKRKGVGHGTCKGVAMVLDGL